MVNMPRYVILDPSADSPETGECSSYTYSHFRTTTTASTDDTSSLNRDSARLGFPSDLSQDHGQFNSSNLFCENHKNSTYVNGMSNRHENVMIDNTVLSAPKCYDTEDDFIVSCAMPVENDGDISKKPPYPRNVDSCDIDDDNGVHYSTNSSIDYTADVFLEDDNDLSDSLCPLNNEENTVFSEKRRLLVNSRERDRMKRLNEAMDKLRKVVPHYPSRKKLSKMETLLMAQNYILALTSLLQQDDAGEGCCRDAEKLAASITKKAIAK